MNDLEMPVTTNKGKARSAAETEQLLQPMTLKLRREQLARSELLLRWDGLAEAERLCLEGS